MKPKLILCLALVLSADIVFSVSVEIHILPNQPSDRNVQFNSDGDPFGLWQRRFRRLSHLMTLECQESDRPYIQKIHETVAQQVVGA
jgi:hypothetical protein